MFACGTPQIRLARQSQFPCTRKDRKSTRLNSSHTVISYAVFCLKTKHRRQIGRSHVWTPVTQCYRMLPSACYNKNSSSKAFIFRSKTAIESVPNALFVPPDTTRL